MIVIGGLGSIPGAFLGAFLIKGLAYFSSIFPSVIRPYLTFFTTGVGLLLVLLLVPGGFSQLFYDLRDRALRAVADRRGIIVPSLVADVRAATADGTDGVAGRALPEREPDAEAALAGAAAGLGEDGE
jgi:hypothetical protein